MARRFLYLVRHGEYKSTTTPPDEPDGGLTEVGKQQAALVAERFRSIPVNRIHHSTAQRAMETAAFISAQFPTVDVHPSDLLREGIPCIPETFKQHFSEIPADFVAKSKVRAGQAFETFFRPVMGDGPDQHEILVSHGNLISHFICRVLDAPCESWIHTDIGLCGFSEVMIGRQGFMKVLRHNDDGHLPLHLKS